MTFDAITNHYLCDPILVPQGQCPKVGDTYLEEIDFISYKGATLEQELKAIGTLIDVRRPFKLFHRGGWAEFDTGEKFALIALWQNGKCATVDGQPLRVPK